MATDEGNSSGSLLKQTLMSHNECFVYKVPPLATASGYRANDWNLATPLETCGFQVERRNNDLYLLFTLENHTKLFALSKIEGEASSINNINVETVMDSSRYFVCKILQSNSKDATKSRTALLGFGFREREIAIDLLGNLQQFRQSIDRELEAKELASKTKSIPVMAEGEKIHIKIPGKPGTPGKNSRKTLKSPGGGKGPILLKKPPPGPLEEPPSPNEFSSTPYNDKKRFSMSAMECPVQSMTISIGGDVPEKVVEEGGGDKEEPKDDNSEAALATSIVDDLLSVDDDLDAPDDVAAGEDETGFDDEQSEGAVGGATVNDNDSTDDSFQFSDLNLDDLDESPAKAPPASTSDDDENFGDFQEA